MLKQTDRIALIMSYVILVACVFSIGWIVDVHNSTESDDRQCDIFRAQVLIDVELALYPRGHGIPAWRCAAKPPPKESMTSSLSEPTPA